MLRRLKARRTVLTSLLETAGFGLIAAGVWQISVPAGWIAAGCAAVLVGALAA